jgi:hypothetical protein
MANELTHALFAGAMMAIINPFLGLDVISWNVFLAGICGMILNLDRSGRRSPFGHSFFFAGMVVYLTGCACYLSALFLGTSLALGAMITLAVGLGLLTHLLLDIITGQTVFTVPKTLNVNVWLSKVCPGSEKFWGGWGRVEVQRLTMKDAHLNAFSIAAILLTIAVF